MKITIGIDIGGTNTQIGAVAESGEILTKTSIRTKNYPDYSDFLSVLIDLIKNYKIQFADSEIIGVGIGAPNGQYYTGTIDNPANLIWKGLLPIASDIENGVGIKAILDNDANTAALGELIYGGAKDMKDFALITLGTGLGSGIVSNGQIVRGRSGIAGELGHTIVRQNGRKCGCGNRGCLETYVSATGIKRTVKYWLQCGAKSEYFNLREKISAKNLDTAAKAGDVMALRAFDFTARLLAMKLADLVAILEPKAIFLLGGLAQAGDFIMIPTQKYLDKFVCPIFHNKVEILPSKLKGCDSAILGAAALIISNTE